MPQLPRCSVKIAFIEMQILSETALIIGAYFSSFSEEAALIHMTPRLMVRNLILSRSAKFHDLDDMISCSLSRPTQVHYDTFIRGFDLSRPNCGDMYRDPLLNMTTLQEYEVQRSGVDPSSTVLFVDAEPCPALTAAWGIENTFCV